MTVVRRADGARAATACRCDRDFDGVHLGHRAVVDAVRATGLEPTVITFDPHPRIALGNRVELLTTLDRRVELLEEAGVADELVPTFTPELQQLTPEQFAERYLRAIGVEAVVAGGTSASASAARAISRFSSASGSRWSSCPSFRASRRRRFARALADGDVRSGRNAREAVELDGLVVAGDQRGGTLGYPTANLRLEPDLACPRYGIYAGFGLEHRAAISIGTNPHYGGTERRIEPYLLGFDGDLYGKRLVVELWERLRDEAVFESEAALVEQIALDVEATERARRP